MARSKAKSGTKVGKAKAGKAKTKVAKTKAAKTKAAKTKAAKTKAAKTKAAKPAVRRGSAAPKPVARPSSARRRTAKPIDLYYWPPPNGWKITVMLEECALPYIMIPVNITKGDQFKPEFLAISPNNRMPAIVDHDGPGGKPISVFESGAILQYLGRKTSKFYPQEERKRVDVEQWLYWQMGGLGPMAGQAHHFRRYAPEQIEYAINRYTNECHRLYGVMNKQLARHDFLAGRYSIADMACVGWASLWERQGQDIAEFPHLKRWLDTVMARPAVARGFDVKVGEKSAIDVNDPAQRALLFQQRAR